MDLGFLPGNCQAIIRHVWHGLHHGLRNGPFKVHAHPIRHVAHLTIAKPAAAPPVIPITTLQKVCKVPGVPLGAPTLAPPITGASAFASAAGVALGSAAIGTAATGLGLASGQIAAALPQFWNSLSPAFAPSFPTGYTPPSSSVLDIPEPSAAALIAAAIAGLVLVMLFRNRRHRPHCGGSSAVAPFDAGAGRP